MPADREYDYKRPSYKHRDVAACTVIVAFSRPGRMDRIDISASGRKIPLFSVSLDLLRMNAAGRPVDVGALSLRRCMGGESSPGHKFLPS